MKILRAEPEPEKARDLIIVHEPSDPIIFNENREICLEQTTAWFISRCLELAVNIAQDSGKSYDYASSSFRGEFPMPNGVELALFFSAYSYFRKRR